MPKLEGAYSTVVMTKDGIVAFRDPHGVRPLSLGRLGDNSFVVASESCAFDIIGAKLLREVEPGEMVSLSGPRARGAPGRARPRKPRTASSSTSTSPAPTPGSRAACSSRCAAGWARSSGARRRSTPTS